MTPHLADTPVLETERLILRAPEGADWTRWLGLADSERAAHIGGPYTRDAAFRAWGFCIGHWALRGYGLFVFVLKDTGEAIGHGGPWQPELWPEPEIAWSIWDAESEGRGYAAEGAAAARAHAYGTLGWPTAVSYIDPDNARSIALAERLGARRDPDAPLPPRDDWEGTLVYRHPAPEALQ